VNILNLNGAIVMATGLPPSLLRQEALGPLQIDTSFQGHFTSLVGSVGRLEIEKKTN